MNSISTAARQHRRLLLAAGYLLVLVCAVMYLRVTISVPPEGDDKLTLNKWLYDFERMPFWQYLLQDLAGRLRYFTLQEVRFFPFHYPGAFSLLFFGSLSSYRLYIIGVTAAADFLVSRLIFRLTRSDALALGGFALATMQCPRKPCSGPWPPGFACCAASPPAIAAGPLRGPCWPLSPAGPMRSVICIR